MKKILTLAAAFFVCAMVGNAQQQTLVLATYTYSTNNRLQNLEPLAAYLSQQTGVAIKAVSYPTVQALLSGIKNDSVDFAMMNTSGYLTLQRNNPGKAQTLVNLDMGNDSLTNYGGCIIALKKTGVSSLQTAAGKKYSLALVTASSTSGNMMPRLLLNAAGTPDAESAFTVSYAGTHKNVVQDVLKGKADLGGCGCAEVDSARKNLGFDERALVVASFHDIPLGPVVYHTRTNEKLVAEVAAVLKNVHLSRPAIFNNFCNGWTEFKQAVKFKPVTDEDYNAFRKMFGNNDALWELLQ